MITFLCICLGRVNKDAYKRANQQSLWYAMCRRMDMKHVKGTAYQAEDWKRVVKDSLDGEKAAVVKTRSEISWTRYLLPLLLSLVVTVLLKIGFDTSKIYRDMIEIPVVVSSRSLTEKWVEDDDDEGSSDSSGHWEYSPQLTYHYCNPLTSTSSHATTLGVGNNLQLDARHVWFKSESEAEAYLTVLTTPLPTDSAVFTQLTQKLQDLRYSDPTLWEEYQAIRSIGVLTSGYLYHPSLSLTDAPGLDVSSPYGYGIYGLVSSLIPDVIWTSIQSQSQSQAEEMTGVLTFIDSANSVYG